MKYLQTVKNQPVLILLTEGSNTGEIGPVKAADIAAPKGIITAVASSIVYRVRQS